MKKYTLLVLVLVALACKSSKENELILQSIEIHESAMKAGNELERKVEELESYASQDSTTIPLDSIQVLRNDLEAWESSIVEVPGHEHDHHDHSGHDHNHEPQPDLTPEMVLEIQQDIKNRVTTLNARAEKLLATIK